MTTLSELKALATAIKEGKFYKLGGLGVTGKTPTQWVLEKYAEITGPDTILALIEALGVAERKLDYINIRLTNGLYFGGKQLHREAAAARNYAREALTKIQALKGGVE